MFEALPVEAKTRYMRCIVWKDSDSYDSDEIIKNIQEQFSDKNTQFAFILHDKDIDVDGNVKKLHYHIAFKFQNERSVRSICKKLDVKPKDLPIGTYDDWDETLAYMLHRNRKAQK